MILSKKRGMVRRLVYSGLCAALALNVVGAAAADAFELSSPGLVDGGTLDSSHAADAQGCGGGNVSPPLQWRNAPVGTKSFAITVFDPDGAKGLGIVHWVLYRIPANASAISEGAQPPAGSVGGINRTGRQGYYGPCPPLGDIPHHYVVQAYALDLPPEALPAGLTRDGLLAALRNHVLAATSIVLRYGR
jgi:Raf kinase inhibitor-like YbhB/YbcL family protein